MAFVQYDPLIQHGEAKAYDEPKANPLAWYGLRCRNGSVSKQFQGSIRSEVYNRANGRWMYQLNFSWLLSRTDVHHETWLYFDDLIEVNDE